MGSRREFIVEGLRQAAKTVVALCLVGLPAIGIFWVSMRFFVGWDNLGFEFFRMVCMFTAWVTASLLAGPIPAVLVHFDISNFTLVLLSVLLVIPYWAVLGGMAGLMRWNDFGNQRDEGLPVVFDKQLKKKLRRTMDAMALFMAVLFFIAGGPLGAGVAPRNYRTSGYIVNNLRQIDAAKQELALERQLPGSYMPTVADLTPYIKLTDGKLPTVTSERYVLDAISNPPYAILTKDWKTHRQGWREGQTVATNGAIYRLSQ